MPVDCDPAPAVHVGPLTSYAEITRYWNSRPDVLVPIFISRVQQICRTAERKLRWALRDLEEEYGPNPQTQGGVACP
jgi:hypothetical protein